MHTAWQFGKVFQGRLMAWGPTACEYTQTQADKTNPLQTHSTVPEKVRLTQNTAQSTKARTSCPEGRPKSHKRLWLKQPSAVYKTAYIHNARRIITERIMNAHVYVNDGIYNKIHNINKNSCVFLRWSQNKVYFAKAFLNYKVLHKYLLPFHWNEQCQTCHLRKVSDSLRKSHIVFSQYLKLIYL